MKSKVDFNVSFKGYVVDICVKQKQVKTWPLYFYLNRHLSFIASNDYIQTKSWPAFLAKQLARSGNHACSGQALSYTTVKF